MGFGYSVAMANAPQEKPRRRWLRLAPDRLVLGLPAEEGFLRLSEWFRWFPFNQHKGRPVLIGMTERYSLESAFGPRGRPYKECQNDGS